MSHEEIIQNGEAAAFASEMHRSFKSLMDFSRKRMGASASDAELAVGQAAQTEAERVAAMPPEQMNWLALAHLTTTNPVEAKAQVTRVKDAYSERSRAPIPFQGGQSFRWKAGTDSGPSRALTDTRRNGARNGSHRCPASAEWCPPSVAMAVNDGA
jgi:hypothetical protein